MTTNYHTAIADGAAANASTFNTPMSGLDSGITNLDARVDALEGGAEVSDEVLKAWTEGECYQMTLITWDSDNVISGASVVWPDGSAGTFTRTTKNSTWLAVDAYTITHTDSGQTVTQAAVTRDGDGNITAKPALTIS